MGFLLKIILKLALNALLLYFIPQYFSEFILTGGHTAIVAGALLLTALNVFLKPIIRFITLPLRLLTFGLFNIAIHVFILWLADKFLTTLTIEGTLTLIITSVIIAVVNAII